MNNKLLIVILSILIIAPFSYAFELNSNELTKNTCQGNTLLFTANVFGVGNFNVNFEGSASSWSTAVPRGFILNNNARTIYVYSTPNNNVNPGTYSLNLIVSNQQESRRIPFTVNVDNCHSMNLVGDVSKEICKGEVISFNYQISNLGNYRENYELKLKGSNFITLSQELISLNPGESKNFYAYISQEADSAKFAVSAFNKYGISEINSNLKVNSCYDFSFVSDKDFVNFCEHSREEVFLTVKNVGVNLDRYDIESKGPGWANLDKKSLVLDPGKSEDIKLILSPDYGVKGNFDIDVAVKSKDGVKNKVLKAQVNKCHDVFLDIQEKDISLCNNAQLPVLVKNTGLFEKEFRIETSEPWASLDNYQVRLGKGDEKLINMLLNVKDLNSGSYDLFVRALVLDGSGLSMDDNLKVRVLKDLQCYNTEISSDNSFSVVQGSSTTIPVTIKNNGNEKLIYEISLTGDGGSFTQINPSILELEPGSSETIYLYSAPSVEVNPGDYSVDFSVSYNNNQLASKNIKINIKESPSEEKYTSFLFRVYNLFREVFSKPVNNVTQIPDDKLNNLDEDIDEESEVKTNKTSWVSGLYGQVKGYWLYLLVGVAVIAILILIFLSGGKDEDDLEKEWKDEPEDDEKDEEDKPLKIGRWILGLILILALIYLQMSYNLWGYIKKYLILGFEYASFYKFYVLISLIFLLILILIIKYWSSILEFFEEEEEKPKPKKKDKKRK